MVKILIFAKKYSVIKYLINDIVTNVKNSKLIGITNTLEESIEMITERKPNLIISTDSKIIQLVKRTFNGYTPGIIFISTNNVEPDFYYKNLLILNKHSKHEKVVKYISNFIKENYMYSRKSQVINILTQIGFNMKLRGTIYLIDSILYTNTYKSSDPFERLERDVYTFVANKYNTTVKRVKWSIERTIKYMHQNHTAQSYYILEKYFAISYPKKPTPKLVINSIATIINM